MRRMLACWVATLVSCASGESAPPDVGNGGSILPGESPTGTGTGGASGKGGGSSVGGTSTAGGFPPEGGVGGATGAGAGGKGASGGTGGKGLTGGSGGSAGTGASGGKASSGGAGGTSSVGGSSSTGGTSAGGHASAGGGNSSTGGTSGGSSNAGGAPSTGGNAGSTSNGGGGAGAGGNGTTGPNCMLGPDYADGSVTFYTFAQGSTAVNCSFAITGQNPDKVAFVPFAGGTYFGAMNTSDYEASKTCGACVQVDRSDNGKSVQLMIVDQCPSSSNPKCTAGHIDLSKEAFLQIGTEAEGYLGKTNGAAVGHIAWHYIPCPIDAPVDFRLKEPTNQFWNQILVEGHRYAIAKVEARVNGIWQPGTRQSYNYWQINDGNMGAPPYEVRATDVNGSVVTASLELKDGDFPGSGQFPVCQ